MSLHGERLLPVVFFFSTSEQIACALYRSLLQEKVNKGSGLTMPWYLLALVQ